MGFDDGKLECVDSGSFAATARHAIYGSRQDRPADLEQSVEMMGMVAGSLP